uniref:Uncharacterized protein n=1 Tax=Euplotes harpa TaxID=151035 RepID=A0A7S3JMB4_9SPIT|mmetsp:Transcript_942/g.905  ORF Transcript_942/g.905 Transcript_942/m.905 type:complete len:115 (+) Transcript_942:139-483(+)|eukprot:CAMPEP_0168336202 /NCGR_PEP_ID=MMETSP0213-20121227/11392_1 /TAXON_ID=151035 /ORGANISM="Euplotes harpa, Strain FSP1.4" /LENGTH=114 /DNA_ID=CAMNT_0008341331 /DNA_START=137 /DNA_END=481 /DNA_ORIENTATION=-
MSHSALSAEKSENLRKQLGSFDDGTKICSAHDMLSKATGIGLGYIGKKRKIFVNEICDMLKVLVTNKKQLTEAKMISSSCNKKNKDDMNNLCGDDNLVTFREITFFEEISILRF